MYYWDAINRSLIVNNNVNACDPNEFMQNRCERVGQTRRLIDYSSRLYQLRICLNNNTLYYMYIHLYILGTFRLNVT